MKNIKAKNSNCLLALLALPTVRADAVIRCIDQIADDADLEEVVSRSTAAVGLSFDRSALRNAAEDALKCEKMAEDCGVQVFSVYEPGYPAMLRGIADAPPVLFVKGNIPDGKSMACVGTRRPDPVAIVESERVVARLVQERWSIVSGLAAGIDAACRAALQYGGSTVAVLANGLDHVFPNENGQLAQEIRASGGALVSEQRFGRHATAKALVRRNRIISGLTQGTTVMQSNLSGGAMLTVRSAIVEDNPVFALRPEASIAGKASWSGNRALLEETGPAFSKLVQAQGRYRKILIERYPEAPVAEPFTM